MPGRNAQVSRIYALLDILEGAPQGLTVAELADRVNERGHQASKRTVYRDVEALNQAGFALFPQGDADSPVTRWVLEKLTKVNEHFVLSARELVALYLAKGALTPLRDTPFYQDLESIFNKIDSKLGSKARTTFTEISSDFRFEPGPRWGLGIDPDVLETVRAGCAEKQILSAVYASANSQTKTKRTLGPHYLYFAKGALYLVAEDLQDKKVKVFSLARMSEALMLDKVYEGTPVTPENYFEGSFGVYRGGEPQHVKLRFSANIASFIKERRWHESQSIVAKNDGTIVLSLDVALTPEFTQWVFGFGALVAILEPGSLQEMAVSAAEAVLELYPKRKAA